MSNQQSTARKISSFSAPTEEDLALLQSLTPSERQALLRAEIERGFEGLSDQTIEEVIAEISRVFPQADG